MLLRQHSVVWHDTRFGHKWEARTGSVGKLYLTTGKDGLLVTVNGVGEKYSNWRISSTLTGKRIDI